LAVVNRKTLYMLRRTCFLALVLIVSGCGGDSGPALNAVSGKVTKAGKPLANVSVTFNPAAGGVASGGRTDDQGRFALVCQNGKGGAVAGKHKVVLKLAEVAAASNSDPMAARDAMMKAREGQMNGGKKGAPVAEKKGGEIPETYANPSTTPLEYDVVVGNNDFDIVIP